MSDWRSLSVLLLQVKILSNNACDFICVLSDYTSHIGFDAWRGSMNICSKASIAWNNSRHPSSWQSNLHCAIKETGSPGIVCIGCHQVLRHPSECGTSSMGKHSLAKCHIAKLNTSTQSEVSHLTGSKIKETAIAILKMPESWGITVVSSLRKSIFDI